MRWVCDECVDSNLVELLRAAGHDVTFIVETAQGAADDQIVHIAEQENRLLLTEDKDFGELIFRWMRPIPGVVPLRIEPESDR